MLSEANRNVDCALGQGRQSNCPTGVLSVCLRIYKQRKRNSKAWFCPGLSDCSPCIHSCRQRVLRLRFQSFLIKKKPWLPRSAAWFSNKHYQRWAWVAESRGSTLASRRKRKVPWLGTENGHQEERVKEQWMQASIGQNYVMCQSGYISKGAISTSIASAICPKPEGFGFSWQPNGCWCSYTALFVTQLQAQTHKI